jgi:hypothetical protein
MEGTANHRHSYLRCMNQSSFQAWSDLDGVVYEFFHLLYKDLKRS